VGFWDNYDDGAGAKFLTGDEKDALAESGEAFDIVGASKGSSKFGPRYVVRVILENGDERAISFATESVESRDRMLDAMIEYLKDENADLPHVRLEKVGRSVLIRSAEAE